MKKGSKEKIREEGGEKIKFAGVVVIVLLLAFVGIALVITNKHTTENSDRRDSGSGTIDAAVEESRLAADINAAGNGVNYEMLRRNGGNLHTYDVLCRSVTEYFAVVFARDYDTAYSLYACGVVEAAGYSYSYDDYVKDMERLLKQLELTGEEENVSGTVHVSYYTEYDNYYTVRLVIQRRNYKNGYVTYDNAISTTYTLVPDEVGDLKVLDFNFHDFKLYSYRFDNVKDSGAENVYEGVIVIPE